MSFSTVDATGPAPAADWSDDGLYKVSLLNLRARARRTLEAIGALPDAHVVVFTHGSFIRCLRAEVLGLNAHHFGACPPTGTPVEMRLVETKGGWRTGSARSRPRSRTSRRASRRRGIRFQSSLDR